MPQLKILINDFVFSETGYDSVFGDDSISSIERKIFKLNRGKQAQKQYTTRRDVFEGFIENFAPEIQEIFMFDNKAYSLMLEKDLYEGITQDWKSAIDNREQIDLVFRIMTAKLVALILAYDTPAEVIVGSENEGNNDQVASSTKTRIIPDEFFGRGTVPGEIKALLRTDEKIYRAWRCMLATTQALVHAFGLWLEKQELGDLIKYPNIVPARTEIDSIQEERGFVREVTMAGMEISVPVEPPMQLLSGYPTYDMNDLKLVLAPYVTKSLNNIEFDKDWNMSVSSNMKEITIHDWSQTSSEDIKRLSDLFRLLRNMLRSPASMEICPTLDPDIKAFLNSLGGQTIRGIPDCWRRIENVIVGIRPNIIYENGHYCGDSLQYSIVLGAAGEEQVPERILDELVNRGSVTIWKNRGMIFLGMIVKTLDEIRSRYSEFMELGREIMMMLSACNALKNIEVEDWQGNLESLPIRPEMDLGRLRHHWLRERLKEELKNYIVQGRVDEAKGVITRVDDREDRNYLKACFVTQLFDIDKEGALSELLAMDLGRDRHDTYHSLMESSLEQGKTELMEEVYRSWLAIDGMSNDYEDDCTPILELAAAGLGQKGILDEYSDELNPGIRTDWIILVMRRFPSKRRDILWRGRTDKLINDLKGNKSINLDRLAGLFETLRKADLPGRESVIKEAIPMLTVEAHRKHYEKRFGIELGKDAVEAGPD